MAKALAIQDEAVASKIYLIRNQKVMLDIDLAELYQVETKRLKRAGEAECTPFPTRLYIPANS